MKSLVLAFALALWPAFAVAQSLLAFPGAEGGGKFTAGGRGGIILVVDTLTHQDGVTTCVGNAPCSFKAACMMNVPRHIVFSVGGIIDNPSAPNPPGQGAPGSVPNYACMPNMSLYGQSAPGRGIWLPSRLDLSDQSIARGFRIRDSFPVSGVFGVTINEVVDDRVHNVMIDHVTSQLHGQEQMGFFSSWNPAGAKVEDITISWSILGPSHSSTGSNEGGGIFISSDSKVGSRNGSIKNLSLLWSVFSQTAKARSPQVGAHGRKEFIELVIGYGEGTRFQAVGQVWGVPPSGQERGIKADWLGNWTTSTVIFSWCKDPPAGVGGANWPLVPYGHEMYTSGNRCTARTSDTQNELLCVVPQPSGDCQGPAIVPQSAVRIMPLSRRTERLYSPFTNNNGSGTMREIVLANAGGWNVIGRSKDELENYVATSLTQSGHNGDVIRPTNLWACNQGGLTCNSDAYPILSGWENSSSRPAGYDTDGGGLSDAFEDANGLNKNNAADDDDPSPTHCLAPGVCYDWIEVEMASLIPCPPVGEFRTPDCSFPTLGAVDPVIATCPQTLFGGRHYTITGANFSPPGSVRLCRDAICSGDTKTQADPSSWTNTSITGRFSRGNLGYGQRYLEVDNGSGTDTCQLAVIYMGSSGARE